MVTSQSIRQHGEVVPQLTQIGLGRRELIGECLCVGLHRLGCAPRRIDRGQVDHACASERRSREA